MKQVPGLIKMEHQISETENLPELRGSLIVQDFLDEQAEKQSSDENAEVPQNEDINKDHAILEDSRAFDNEPDKLDSIETEPRSTGGSDFVNYYDLQPNSPKEIDTKVIETVVSDIALQPVKVEADTSNVCRQTTPAKSAMERSVLPLSSSPFVHSCLF